MGSLGVGHDWATSLSLFTFHFHALEKEMATQSSVLAWRIPGTAEPHGLPSMGSHRVRHNWSDLAAAAARISLLLMSPHSHFPSTNRTLLLSYKSPLFLAVFGTEPSSIRRTQWLPTPVLLPGKSHERRSLVYFWTPQTQLDSLRRKPACVQSK